MSQMFLIIAVGSLLIVILLVLKVVLHAISPYLKQIISFIQSRPTLKRICIASQNISIPNNSITTHSITFHDKDGKIIDAYKKDFFEEIIPDSYGYTISETIRNYAKEHHDEVVRNTYGN